MFSLSHLITVSLLVYLHASPEADSVALQNAVKDNNRKTFVSIFSKYTPPHLTPAERHIWDIWLEAIESPSQEEGIVLYRGMGFKDGSFNQQRTLFGVSHGIKYFHELNRLLKHGTTEIKNPMAEIPHFDSYFHHHSNDSKSSPFLSTTTVSEVSLDYGYDVILGLRMKKNRYLFNPNSYYVDQGATFDADFEVLVPFAIFPDEVEVRIPTKNSDSKFNRRREEITKDLNRAFSRPAEYTEPDPHRDNRAVHEFKSRSTEQLNELLQSCRKSLAKLPY